VRCGGECARRLDESARQHVDDRSERVLVVHAGVHAIADMLARELRRDGLIVDVADASPRGAPPPADYDAVIVATRERWRRLAQPAVAYLEQHRGELATMPRFVVLVRDRVTRRFAWDQSRTFQIEAPSLRARWLGEPPARTLKRERSVREIALAISDAIP
jgi:hypothetical protein